jgi:hypothetical protein
LLLRLKLSKYSSHIDTFLHIPHFRHLESPSRNIFRAIHTHNQGLPDGLFSNQKSKAWNDIPRCETKYQGAGLPTRVHQGCQIFLGTAYQNGGKVTKFPQNIPNGHEIHTPIGREIFWMATKYPDIVGSKISPNWDFWFEKKPVVKVITKEISITCQTFTNITNSQNHHGQAFYAPNLTAWDSFQKSKRSLWQLPKILAQLETASKFLANHHGHTPSHRWSFYLLIFKAASSCVWPLLTCSLDPSVFEAASSCFSELPR